MAVLDVKGPKGFPPPGAMGWEGFLDIEQEHSPETRVLGSIADFNQSKQSKTGSTTEVLITGAAKVTGGLLNAAGGVFSETTSASLGLIEMIAGSKEVKPDQEAQIYTKQWNENLQKGLQSVERKKEEQIVELTSRITGGTMSAAEIVEAVFTGTTAGKTNSATALASVGVSEVFMIWNERAEKRKAAEQAQQDQSLAQASGKSDLSTNLNAQEGQSQVANAIATAG